MRCFSSYKQGLILKRKTFRSLGKTEAYAVCLVSCMVDIMKLFISLMSPLILGHVFPEEFYTFLRYFFTKFAGTPVLTPDEKIMR